MTRDDSARRTTEEARRDLEALKERERLAGDLNHTVINRIFRAGLSLHGVQTLTTDPVVFDRIDEALDELDAAVHGLRTVLFRFGSDTQSA